MAGAIAFFCCISRRVVNGPPTTGSDQERCTRGGLSLVWLFEIGCLPREMSMHRKYSGEEDTASPTKAVSHPIAPFLQLILIKNERGNGRNILWRGI